MQSKSSSLSSLSSLCECLRSERLLINNEQTILQNLSSKSQSERKEIYKLTWICRHEKAALSKLINSDPSVSPDNCCQLMAKINSTKFIEGYKALGHHITTVCLIFKYLHEAPKAVAEFLVAAEKLNSDVSTDKLNRAVFNVLYSSCVFQNDEKSMAELLGHLMSLQLIESSDPRKLLRKCCSTFSKMYKFFSEELFAAKVFLTAALHEPVMFLLSQDELFLDIDPAKSILRFSAAERVRRFGSDENSEDYINKVAEHRKTVEDKLVLITNHFLQSIRSAMTLFPSRFTWLVRHLQTGLLKKQCVGSEKDAALICTDMVFTYFLCSAIVHPEEIGIISDTPVEHIARFNLIQVGQVMQNLALLPYEVPAPQMHRLLVKLDNDCMSEIVQKIFISKTLSPVELYESEGNEVNASCRKVCVGTLQEIKIILASLNHSAVNQITDVRLHKKLENEIKKLPVELKSNRTEVLILPVSENNDALLRYREAYSVADIKGSPVDTYHDPKNLEKCKAFLDAKRKLRSVLSSAPDLVLASAAACNNNLGENKLEELHKLLKRLLAESINSREHGFSAQVREVQRCLIVLGNEGIYRLLATLESEHQERASHISRLQNLRASLLQLNYYLFRTKTRIQREKALSAECLLEILVRFFLEGKDLFLRQFVHDFRCLKAQDERTKTVEQALRFLNERFYIEPMWRFATSDNLDYAQKCLERSLMAHVYKFAMFPNGDADHSRDAIFYKSIQKLSLRLTITHPDLGILKKYHGECPWPSAQAEIAIINAYKSPCDKIGCVVRCCETIENLISLSSDVGTVCADDLLPVLVYVLLQANPPTLLSNIQYINDFYADRMQGQAAYWWTQFAASVEFLKQLLNRHL